MMKISVAIITLNEEHNIAAALESVKWADEVVVVDSGSSDKTMEIAQSFGAKTVFQEWLGFGLQKQFAVDLCSNDWVLSIDADETVTPELRKEIENLNIEDQPADAYFVPRKTIYMGRPILHSGWYPDHTLRLFNKNKGKWKDAVVHESFIMQPDTVVQTLNNVLNHITVRSVLEHYKMIGERYAPLGAEQMRKDGINISAFAIVFVLPVTFLRTYILKLGILDGFPGFVIAIFAGYNSFLKYLLRYEKQQGNSDSTKG